VALAGIVFRALVFGVPFPGFGTIASLLLLLFGFLFLFLGIVSEYVGMTFNEVRARPSFVVRAKDGLDD
jgi:dolichol-phosphate mannosyltransferase